MGAQVKGSTGDNLGTINDFVVNPQTGRIEFAVLSLTGPTGTTPTGVGEKLTPVPWRLLNFNSGAGGIGQQQYTFTATVDQSKLQSAHNQPPDEIELELTRLYSIRLHPEAPVKQLNNLEDRNLD